MLTRSKEVVYRELLDPAGLFSRDTLGQFES